MTAAELCRKNGWIPGDVLRADFQNCIDDRIILHRQICAIFSDFVLTREPESESDWWLWESQWNPVNDSRPWQKIANAPLDETPPNREWLRD